MTLSSKTLIIIGVTILCLLAILYGVSQLILRNSFNQLEEQHTRENVERALSALSDDIAQVASTVGHWAPRDDTCRFVEDRNEGYIQSNLGDTTFRSLELNLMLFTSTSGYIVHAKGFDLQANKESAVPRSFEEHLSANSLLAKYGEDDTESTVSGLLLLPEGPLLIASHPILTSAHEGPVRGAMIAGAYLDSEEIKELAQTTHLSLAVESVSQPQLPSDFQLASLSLSDGTTVFVRPLNEESTAGYALVNDIYGAPALILRVDEPREIYQQGLVSSRYFIVSLVAAGMVFLVVTLVLLRRLVLSPVSRLSAGISSVGSSGDLSARVSVTGKDELASLAGSINGMLGTMQRSQTALRDSEQKYRILFEGTADGIVLADVETGKVAFANRNAARMYGFASAEEVTGVSVLDFVQPEDRAVVVNGFAKDVYEAPKPQRYEVRTRTRDAGTIWVSALATRARFEGRLAVLFSLRDITERKKSEEELRLRENAMENSLGAIAMADMEGRVTYVNQACLRLWGTNDKTVLVGKRYWELTEWQLVGLDEVAGQIERAMSEDKSWEGELVGRRKDGREVNLHVSTARVKDEHGKPIQTVSCFIDITERKKAIEALRQSEEYFRSLIEDSMDCVVVLDSDGVIRYRSMSFERILGYKPEERAGTHPFDIVHPDDLPKAATAFARLLQNPHGTIRTEVRALHKSGSLITLDVVGRNLLDNPAVHGIVANFRDVTDRKRAEEDVARHTRQVEALHAVARSLSSTLDLDGLLRSAMERVVEVMRAQAGVVYLVDPEKRLLALKSRVGLSEEEVLQLSTVKLTEEEFDRLRQWEYPYITLSQIPTEAILPSAAQLLEREQMRSFAAVPSSVRGELQSIVAVGRRTELPFTQDDLELLQAIGNEIAVGIENARLLERTRELSVKDELTGLYNRRHFYEALDAEAGRIQRYGGQLSLVILDLDGFRAYNATYGHTAGDNVLRAIAQTVKTALRKTDIPFRHGPDEFTVILPTTDATTASRIVDRIRAKWAEVTEGLSLSQKTPLGLSAAIAQFPIDAETADGLVFLANTALFQSKKGGGNRSTLVSDLAALPADALDSAILGQVLALAATVDARDPFTYGHSTRVATIAEMIGRAAGLSKNELSNLHAAGLLHDTGKVGVPDAILTKPDKLAQHEWTVIRKHSAEGARIVSYVRELAPIVPIIRHHHEWYNGTGYPDGLKGREIPLGARIVSIADAYDTMTTRRPYREVVSQEEACAELRRCSGTQFDPELVDIFCRAMDERPKPR